MLVVFELVQTAEDPFFANKLASVLQQRSEGRAKEMKGILRAHLNGKLCHRFFPCLYPFLADC
jgi:hypothetical protein